MARLACRKGLKPSDNWTGKPFTGGHLPNQWRPGRGASPGGEDFQDTWDSAGESDHKVACSIR